MKLMSLALLLSLSLLPMQSVKNDSSQSVDVFGRTEIQSQGSLIKPVDGKAEIRVGNDLFVLENLPDEAALVELCRVEDLDPDALAWIRNHKEVPDEAGAYVVSIYDRQMNPVSYSSLKITMTPSEGWMVHHLNRAGELHKGTVNDSSRVTFTLSSSEYLVVVPAKTSSSDSPDTAVSLAGLPAIGLISATGTAFWLNRKGRNKGADRAEKQ